MILPKIPYKFNKDDFEIRHSINLRKLECEIIQSCYSDYAVEEPDLGGRS